MWPCSLDLQEAAEANLRASASDLTQSPLNGGSESKAPAKWQKNRSKERNGVAAVADEGRRLLCNLDGLLSLPP